MATPTQRAPLTVALLGNPNTGKSTLFTALVGASQRTGNYPGVTVEKKVGKIQCGGRAITLIDLPGTYSLAPRSLDEMVTVDVLLGRRGDVSQPDAVICIVDASNLQRNLYLVSQALEIGCPIIIALNKMDMLKERGIQLDAASLQQRLGVMVIEMQAHRRLGLDALQQALGEICHLPAPEYADPLPEKVRDEVTQLQRFLQRHLGRDVSRFLTQRLLFDSGGYLQDAAFDRQDRVLANQVQAARDRLSDAGCPIPAVETSSRFDWVDSTLAGVLEGPEQQQTNLTDLADRLLTHRLGGTLVFGLLMVVVFQAIFRWAGPFQALIEEGVAAVGSWIGSSLQPGVLESLLADGIVAGVGAVLVFLPQIAMLFLFVSILEECGYMSRAAYLMDRMMSRVGLSGKSFIPLLSSFACAVPGIMATRTIEDRRDRFATILVAPLMSCSARLPVYTLLIAAFIPDERFLGGWIGLQGITIVALYLLGVVVAIVVAKLLKLTVLRGQTPPFVMELPDYRAPSPRVVARRVAEQCWAFLRGAGTLILSVTVVVWAAAYFPHSPEIETRVRAEYAGEMADIEQQIEAARAGEVNGQNADQGAPVAELERQRQALEATVSRRIAGAYMEHSVLGRLGKLIEPVVRPLGWDWRIGCAVIASFPAREVVIGAMGVIYNLGDSQDEESVSLKQKLNAVTWPQTDRPVFTVPVALSIMVFFALCAQCAATLVVIKKETASYRWPLLTFVYMTFLAYMGAMLTYQIGTWLVG